MSKNTTTQSTELAQLKLAVIKFHNANAYTEAAIARDACYTSHNSVQFKTQQMADTAAGIKDLIPARGSEVVDVQLARLIDRYEGMEEELAVLSDRHAADCEVFKLITGDTWSAKPKRTHKASGLGLDSRLAKFG